MNKNKEVNEVFAKKLEELIIKEVEGVVEKLKGLNMLNATVKLTSDELYELIKRNANNSDDFILTVDINANSEIKVTYYYKNKKIQAVTTEESKDKKIDVLTLLQLCCLQDTNIPVVEFELYECTLHGLQGVNKDEIDELNSILSCKQPCSECDYYEHENVNLFKNN